MKNNNLIITIVVAVVVAAAAFFGGMKYQQSKSAQTAEGYGQFQRGGPNGQGGQFGQGRQGGGRGGFGGASIGQVVSMDANSITLKLQDGSSKIINISSSTKFSKMDSATKSDIKVGDRIAAIGQPASDGSIDAQNIQLNPMFRMGRGGTGTPSGAPAQQ